MTGWERPAAWYDVLNPWGPGDDFYGEFELAVMTGHAFQELVGDDERRRSLRAVRAALVDGGRFAFEIRHPRARAWEGWNSSFERPNSDGDAVRVS